MFSCLWANRWARKPKEHIWIGHEIIAQAGAGL